MIVEKFLSWSLEATPTQRADGASALARAYLYAPLDPSARGDAERALTQLLDDHSPLVRRAIAEAFASALDAPQHIVLALADDQSDVSAIVLARSPVLSDAALIDCAAVGDAFAQSAIAVRPGLSAGVAAAIAEVGAREALVSLAVNTSADLPDCAALRMLDRFGADGELREALLARPDLSAGVRCRLMEATAAALAKFAVACRWLSDERAGRLVRDGRERAHVIIAAQADGDAAGELVAHLRTSGQLTSALLLRSLLCGRTSLFAAALSQLAGVPGGRVAALLRDWRSSAFAALYRRAGLPLSLLPGFRAVLDALQAGPVPSAGTDLSRALIDGVLARCEAANAAGALDKLLVVLRRLHVEAVRDAARRDVALAVPISPMTAGLQPDAPAPAQIVREPLLLGDPDLDPRLGDRPQAAQRALRAMPRFTIDFTALEAELLAA